MVYSPLDAVALAEVNPDKKVVFFAIGFETTAPANAVAVLDAERRGIENFSILCSQVLVPPAIEAILSSPHSRVQGFLAAGHVCTVMGFEEYIPLADKFQVPIVVTGFEPVDILEGIYLTVKQLEENRYGVENQYRRVVKKEGNPHARKIVSRGLRRDGRSLAPRGIAADIPMNAESFRASLSASFIPGPRHSPGSSSGSGFASFRKRFGQEWRR